MDSVHWLGNDWLSNLTNDVSSFFCWETTSYQSVTHYVSCSVLEMTWLSNLTNNVSSFGCDITCS